MSAARTVEDGADLQPAAAGRRRLRFEPGDIAAQSSIGHRVFAISLGLGVIAIYLTLQTSLGTGVFSTIWSTTFGSSLGVTQVLQLTSALVLAGAANAVALRAGLWNLGVEGQLFIGAWAATGVAFTFGGLPGPLLAVLMIVAGALGGAAWMLVPALLKAYLDVSELVTTLLLNFVALLWLAYWINGPWAAGSSGVGALTTRSVPAGAMFPDFSLGTVTIGLGLVIALAVSVGLWLFLRYTSFGYFATILGENRRTAQYAGVDTRRTTIAVLLLSGAIGGLLGVVVELDTVGQYSTALSDNTGYLGIGVAVLAGYSLLGVVPMGVLLAFLAAAGNGLRIAGLSGDVLLLFTGILLFCAALANVLARYRVSFAHGVVARVDPPPPDDDHDGGSAP